MPVMRKRGLDDWLYGIGWLLIPVSVMVCRLYERAGGWSGRLFCPVDRILGIYCPGCGGTRAVWLLFHGRPMMSVWYHPFVLYTAVLYAAFMISQTFARLTGYRWGNGMVFREWYLYGGVAVIAVNFVLKNVLRLVWHIYL